VKIFEQTLIKKK